MDKTQLSSTLRCKALAWQIKARKAALAESRRHRRAPSNDTGPVGRSSAQPATARLAPSNPVPSFFPVPGPSPRARLRHRAMVHSLAPKTLSNYESTIRRFWVFCGEHDIPVGERFPASRDTLIDFVASFAGSRSSSTALGAISALHAWHNAHNAPWNADPSLGMVSKGVANLAPASSKRKERPPVTMDMLRLLHDDLDLGLPFDAAVFAAAVIAFWAVCRLGELLGTSRRRHNPKAQPSRSSIGERPAVGNPVHLTLPRKKTTGPSGATVLVSPQTGRLDTGYALARHFHTNAKLPPSAHLFAFRNAEGELRCLTLEGFMARCNAIWETHDLPRFTGHSFRIGGTNAYLAAGVPSDVVRMHGRWKSDAYFVYWRNQDRLNSKHTQRISTKTN